MDEGCVIIADGGSKGYGFAKRVYEFVSRKPERDFPISLVHVGRTVFEDKEYKLRILDNI